MGQIREEVQHDDGPVRSSSVRFELQTPAEAERDQMRRWMLLFVALLIAVAVLAVVIASR